MNKLSLNVARCALSAWIAAAAMFVITSVREVTSPEFSSTIRSHLALLRFPIYYTFGFTLLPIAILATGFAWIRIGKAASLRWVMGLLLLALVLMVVDYAGIYSPMVKMLTAESTGLARPANFTTYHRASETMNSLGVLLCLGALITLCAPWAERAKGREGEGETL